MWGSVFGQTPQPYPVTPKSPNVANIERFGNYEVNLFHGLPDISINLFEISSKDLKVPITLSYHASGIKVSDVASWVGLGWSINTGGQISRKVKGKVDEEPSGFLHSGFNFRNPTQIDPYTADGYFYLNSMLTGNSDTDPDIFAYTIPGNFGHFIYRGVDSSAILVPYKPIKLERTAGTSSVITSFKLTDGSGTNFIFGHSSAGEDAVEESLSTRGGTTSSFRSSWLLTDMINADKSDTIKFKYNTPNSITLSQQTEDYVEVIDHINSIGLISCNMSPSINTSYRNTNYSVSQQLLKEIQFDQGKVEFVLSANNRNDLASKSLDRINIYSKVKSGYQLLKAIRFFYSYFTGANTSRLKLDSISVQSTDALQKQVYRFAYKSTTDFPSVDSKTKDYWGYYNSYNNNTNLVPGTMISYAVSLTGTETTTNIGGAFGNREPDSNLVQIGILNRIQYPTGGYTVFTYEANKYKKGAEIRIGGGVRIKSILNYSSADATPIIKSYMYGNDRGEENGLGVLNSIVTPQFSPTQMNSESWILFEGRPNPSCSYLYRNYGSNPTFDNNDFDETNVFYPFVTEYEGTRGNNNGKTTYYYSSTSDNILTSFIPFRPQVESYHWMRGKLLEKKVYRKEPSGDYKLLYELNNVYTVINPRTVENVGCLVAEVNYRTGTFDETVQYSHNWPLPFQYTFYNVHTGTYELSSSDEKIYEGSSNSSLGKAKFYEYNSNAEIKLIKSVESNTDTLYQRFKYASDYPATSGTGDAAGIIKLKELNIVDKPIEEIKSIKPKQGQLTTIGGTLKTFYATTPLLKDEYFLETGTPISNIQESAISNGVLNFNSNYKKRISYTAYNAANNIMEYYLDNAANKSAFIWGYNNSLITAIGKNIGKDQLAYSSFEDEDKGNWTYNENAVKVLTTDAVSGQYVYDFAVSGTISKTGLPNGTYIVTYWSKTPCKVNNTDPTVWQTDVYRNLKLYAHSISVTNGTISVTSTSSKIDDLCMQADGSAVQTYAYLPAVGPITSTQQQKVTYYQYDGLQRLKLMKDMDENALQKYDYSNSSAIQLGTVNTIYYNTVKTQVFKRNNCPTTDYGTSISYVVPANSYISFISQADADAQATADVNSNGQAYANLNCECRPKTEVQWQPYEPYCQMKIVDNSGQTTTGYGVTVSSVAGTDNYTQVSLTRTQAQASYRAEVTIVIYFTGDNTITAHFIMEKGQLSKEGTVGVSPYLNANRNGAAVTNVENLDSSSQTGYQVYAKRQKLVGGEVALTEPNLKDEGEGPYFEPIQNTSSCPITFVYDNIPSRAAYANREMSQTFRKQCGTGQVGSSVLYLVPAGTYTSSISQQDADNKAINDINLNGQNYANQHGECYTQPNP